MVMPLSPIGDGLSHLCRGEALPRPPGQGPGTPAAVNARAVTATVRRQPATGGHWSSGTPLRDE
jgi:hypothetical protein